MICFVIALDGEAEPVLANIKNAQMQLVYGKKVYFGEMCGDEVRLIVCGVGKVNAAAATMLAVERYRADAIINIGTAGALHAGLPVGSICAVTHAAEYDFDLCAINGTEMGVLNEFTERWLPLERAGAYTPVRLATGDRFNDDRKDYEMLTQDFKADLRDMEGAAVAHVCAHTKTPAYLYKAVSDVAGSGSTADQYSKNIALCYQNTGLEICKIYRAVKESVGK